MSPKIKERFELTGWSVAISLLGVILWFLIQINEKVDYSYKSNVEQQIINKNYSDNIEILEENLSTMGINVAELAKRQYHLEQKLNEYN